MARITKAQMKARDAAIDAERESNWTAYEALRARFDGAIFKARVVFWRGSKGTIEGLNGEGRFWLHSCNVKGARTWYPETACMLLKIDDIIDAEIKVFYGPDGCIAVSHTPGTLDVERWASLDKSKLAFKCDDDGALVSGLFAK